MPMIPTAGITTIVSVISGLGHEFWCTTTAGLISVAGNACAFEFSVHMVLDLVDASKPDTDIIKCQISIECLA